MVLPRRKGTIRGLRSVEVLACMYAELRGNSQIRGKKSTVMVSLQCLVLFLFGLLCLQGFPEVWRSHCALHFAPGQISATSLLQRFNPHILSKTNKDGAKVRAALCIQAPRYPSSLERGVLICIDFNLNYRMTQIFRCFCKTSWQEDKTSLAVIKILPQFSNDAFGEKNVQYIGAHLVLLLFQNGMQLNLDITNYVATKSLI